MEVRELNSFEISNVSGAGDGDSIMGAGLFLAGLGAATANPVAFTIGMAVATGGAGINLVQWMREHPIKN